MFFRGIGSMGMFSIPTIQTQEKTRMYQPWHDRLSISDLALATWH